jgi:peptide/nickel transport system substrate-binding protein
MQDPDQSFQVINNRTIQLKMGSGYLGVPYAYILATLAAPIAAAVDPVVITANGGVNASTNDWMSTNTLGTGPYTLATYLSGSGFTLQPDANYWGAADAAKEPWNNILQPAKSSIQLSFQSDPAKTTTDLRTGAVAGASFAYLGPSTVNDLKNSACVAVVPLDAVYSSTAGAWWIYMNQNVQPFNNWSVRAAIAHAINYDQILSVAFGGNAIRWVGPVPPAYPYYNPDNLQPYAFDLTLARYYMQHSPYPGGVPGTIKYAYIDLGDWADVALILKSNLAQINITIEPVPITLDNLYQEQARDSHGVCATTTTANGGPFYMGQEFYTSDYISPDDWTQNNAISYGSANDCMSQFNNATMDAWVLQAAGERNPTTLTALYRNMTRMMYDDYTDVWLVSPTQFAVSNPLLKGVVQNPMGSALPFTMSFNTEYAMKP